MSVIRSLVAFPIVVGIIGFCAVARSEQPPTFADRGDSDVTESSRALAILFNPLAVYSGVFGAEADFVAAQRLAVSIEGNVAQMGGATCVLAGVGLLFFPQRSAFSGFYLGPRAVLARPLGESPYHLNFGTDVLGLGAVAGWQWTWDYGLSFRLGGGAMHYEGGPSNGPPGVGLKVREAELVLDSALGWAF